MFKQSTFLGTENAQNVKDIAEIYRRKDSRFVTFLDLDLDLRLKSENFLVGSERKETGQDESFPPNRSNTTF